MELLEGREYAYGMRSYVGIIDPDCVTKVRLVKVREDDVVIKMDFPKESRGHNVSEKVRREYQTGYGIDFYAAPFNPGSSTTTSRDSLLCLWEDWPKRAQEIREENKALRNSRWSRWYLSRGSKPRYRSKWKGLSKPGARPWENSTKENRIEANRRDRHDTKIKIREDLKKVNS